MNRKNRKNRKIRLFFPVFLAFPRFEVQKIHICGVLIACGPQYLCKACEFFFANETLLFGIGNRLVQFECHTLFSRSPYWIARAKVRKKFELCKKNLNKLHKKSRKRRGEPPPSIRITAPLERLATRSLSTSVALHSLLD